MGLRQLTVLHAAIRSNREAISIEVSARSVVSQAKKSPTAEAAASPLMMIAFVMLGLSLIANLILIVLLAT